MSPTDRAKTATGIAYQPAVALQFFRSAGEMQSVAAGTKILSENEKAIRFLLQHDRMYLLLKGEVEIVSGRKSIGKLKPGAIFGEMAPLTDSARSATAIARSACELIGLDEDQFHAALEMMPEFALMLMSVMILRLRDTVARLVVSGTLPADPDGKDSAVFDHSTLDDLARELADAPQLHFAQGQTIVQEGGAGVLMYVVLEGRVAASIRGTPVEHIGPGGVFGEIALVDQAPRVASAVAETKCTLLPINRAAFLALVKAKPAFGASILRALADRLRFLVARQR